MRLLMRLRDGVTWPQYYIYADIWIKLYIQKQVFEVNWEIIIWNDIWFKKYTSKCDKIGHNIMAKVVYLRNNKIRTNALLLIYKKIGYLDFINIY